MKSREESRWDGGKWLCSERRDIEREWGLHTRTQELAAPFGASHVPCLLIRHLRFPYVMYLLQYLYELSAEPKLAYGGQFWSIKVLLLCLKFEDLDSTCVSLIREAPREIDS